MHNAMRVALVSRCSRTIYIFRRALIAGIEREGGDMLAIGGGGDGYDGRLRAAGVRFEDVPISQRGIAPFSDIRLLLRLRSLFRRERPTIVHCFTIKPAIFATLAAASARVPVRVVTITGLGYAFTSAPGPLRWLVEKLYRFAFRFAHLVYFQNEQDRELFLNRHLVARKRTALIAGSGVDIERFARMPLPSQGARPVVFLMIARLLRDKGVLEYAEAASQAKLAMPAARFLLLGGEDSRNPSALTAAEIANIRARGAVEIMDEVDDVRAVIATADVAVLPSYREGLSRSLLEAAAMGRALIASDVPGCSDVVQHGVSGLLVPARDSGALTKAMVALAENPAMIAKYGAEACAQVRERFDEKIVISDTLAAYRRLMAERIRDEASASAP